MAWRPITSLTTITLALALVGCSEGSSSSGQGARNPYAVGSALMATRGHRALIVDGEGELIAKWRVRRRDIKLYDASRRPLGRARMPEGGDAPLVEVLDRKLAPTIVAARGDGPRDAIEVGEVVSIESRGAGWVLYDQHRLLIGVLSIDDARGASLRESVSAEAPVMLEARVAESGGSTEVLDRQGDVVVRAPARVGPLVALAHAIDHDDLGVSERAALGLALERLAEGANE